MLMLLVLLTQISGTSAQKKMYCTHHGQSQYWRLTTRTQPCVNQTLNLPPCEVNLTIYRPNTDPQTLSGARCRVQKTTYTIWKNLINEEKQSVYSEYQPVTIEECCRMFLYSVCQHGKLLNGRTNKNPDLDYSYWKTIFKMQIILQF